LFFSEEIAENRRTADIAVVGSAKEVDQRIVLFG